MFLYWECYHFNIEGGCREIRYDFPTAQLVKQSNKSGKLQIIYRLGLGRRSS